MRRLLAVIALSVLALAASPVMATPAATAQEVDEEVPPGNPVIGDDRPGDIEPENDTTNYGLWALVAVCLIAAGVLLVKIERWEARRHPDDDC